MLESLPSSVWWSYFKWPYFKVLFFKKNKIFFLKDLIENNKTFILAEDILTHIAPGGLKNMEQLEY